MSMSMDGGGCTIRIYDRELNWIYESKSCDSVQLTRELYGPGTFEIHIHPDKLGFSPSGDWGFSESLGGAGGGLAAYSGHLPANRHPFQKNNIITFNLDGHRSGLIREFHLEERSGRREYVVYGETGASLTGQRIVVPPTRWENPNALGWERIRGPAETVIKHFAAMNMTSPGDSARRFSDLILAADLRRGIDFPWQARFGPLDEVLRDICSFADMGYEIYADIENRRWIFDVIPGTDRTKNQTALSPVSFNMEFQNIESYRYLEEYRNFRNTGYAGGEGEDENRLIYILGGENTGHDRFETFLDCGMARNINELIHYGTQRLSEFREIKSLELSALPKVFRFEKDYFLGDKVSVYISRLGLSIDARITTVREIWERQGGYRAQIRFGAGLPSIHDVLGRAGSVR